MSRVRFIMLGGFLGAGKTTTVARLARHYRERGLRIGIVTNDQAQNLVDTNSLRSQNLAVAEVPGACFCCKFDELIGTIAGLQASERPDIILAEPVGSCTDLVATVIQPLKDLYGRQFQVGPYAVLFKPSHGLKILRNEADAGFSPKAAYIFRKQLEEADAIVLNRIDELSAPEIDEISRLIDSNFPGVPLLKISAKTGQGIEALLELLDQDGSFGRRVLDIDYDTYAEGEAELGWLNSSVHISAVEAFDLDQLILETIGTIRESILNEGEIAHLKVIGLADGVFSVANVVSNEANVELSLPSRSAVAETDLIVNARVAMDPAILQSTVAQAITAACRKRNATANFRQTQSLRPGRPVPTHRYAVPAE